MRNGELRVGGELVNRVLLDGSEPELVQVPLEPLALRPERDRMRGGGELPVKHVGDKRRSGPLPAGRWLGGDTVDPESVLVAVQETDGDRVPVSPRDYGEQSFVRVRLMEHDLERPEELFLLVRSGPEGRDQRDLLGGGRSYREWAAGRGRRGRAGPQEKRLRLRRGAESQSSERIVDKLRCGALHAEARSERALEVMVERALEERGLTSAVEPDRLDEVEPRHGHPFVRYEDAARDLDRVTSER